MSEALAEKMSKRQAVEQAMGAGITSPKKIAEWVKEKYGVEITPPHVSTIKNGINNGPRAPRPRKESNGSTPDHAPVKDCGPTVSMVYPNGSSKSVGCNLDPIDLANLVRLSRRAGGVEYLKAFLSALEG